MLGTRGSALALAQVRLVETALRAVHPALEIAVETFTTSGDRRTGNKTTAPAGVKGMFTRELEEALRAGRIDAAVHSLKDLPGQTPEGLSLPAVLERAPVEDVLLAKSSNPVSIGTGSVRRRMQLLRARPGVLVRELRGNVPTRLRKLQDSDDLDAIILARAGLDRLSFSIADGQLRFENTVFRAEILGWMLPAIGQGAIALQARTADTDTMHLLSTINHSETHLCIRAEREFLRLLDGDCDLPVGARTALAGDHLAMEAIVFGEDGAPPRTGATEGSASAPEALAEKLFRMLHAE